MPPQNDVTSNASTVDVTTTQAASKRGPIRKARRQSAQGTEVSASGRTHEENQERAYIAASRRSDRSIEARLESARRASEIHRRRCGRGLRVTEEAVMNEEMYEEEDPDYEQRVSRLRMAMTIPNFVGYQPYPMHMLPQRGSVDSGGSSTPGTPSTQHLPHPPTPSFQQNVAEPAMFFYPQWWQAQAAQVPASPLSPSVPTMNVAPGPMSPAAPAMQSPAIPSTPSTHFLPPTQFPPKKEATMVAKSIAPLEIHIPEHEVVLDPAPLDLFADVNFDMTENNSDSLWAYSNQDPSTIDTQDWFTQQE